MGNMVQTMPQSATQSAPAAQDAGQKIVLTAVVRPEGFMLGATREGLGGYVLMGEFGTFPSYEAAQKEADRRNEQAGISAKEAIAIVLGSFREA